MMKHAFQKWLPVLVLFLIMIFPSHVLPKEIYTGLFGIWAWGDWAKGLQLVSDNKFDLAVGVSSRHNLDKANLLGIKCFVDIGLKKEMILDNTKWQHYTSTLKKTVTELKDHPAVFAWYIVDEPDWQDIPEENIKIICNMVRSIDKSKPIFTVLGNKDKWERYLPYFDIVAIDPYITRNAKGDIEKIGKIKTYITKIKNDIRKQKLNTPLWIVLGAFDQVPKKPGTSSHFVKPTPQEFNEMVEIAVKEGLDGILVYTLAGKGYVQYQDWNLPKDDPPLWQAVRNLPNKVKHSSH